MSARANTREQLWRSIVARSAHGGPDFELLERWRAGERAAGAELCRRHFERLRGFFATKCRDDAAALATETLLASARAGAPEGERQSFRAYLFALARRELHRHLQQRRRGARIDPTGLRPAPRAEPAGSPPRDSLTRIDFATTSIAELLAPDDDAPPAPPAISGPGSRAGSSS